MKRKHPPITRTSRPVVILWILLVVLAACKDNTQSVPTRAIAGSIPTPVSGTPPAVETPAPTVIPLTATPSEPLAALVNDQPIFLADYEKELARYEQARAELRLNPGDGDVNYHSLVLDMLVERSLIAQAAESLGIRITPQMVDEKLAELRTAAGDSGNFDAWLVTNQWTEDEFRQALAAEMLTEQVVAAVTADVPMAVEQVRARYLQVDDLALMQSLVQRIANGEAFAALAEQYSLDRATAQNGGDLGYFARGSLLVPALEEAAYSLEPGEVSDIITAESEDGTHTTYYLVKLINRDPERLLTADMRYAMLQQAFEEWLDAQWEQATVVRFVDTDT
ncbi:MAG: peptidylprolyl isomerase [Anaerolineae bacterium]